MDGGGAVDDAPSHLLRSLAPHLGARIRVVRRLDGGFRNENLLVEVSGRRLVIRRSPTGDLAAQQALLTRLHGAVPVPAVVFADPSGEVVGEPVMVSEFVPGIRADLALDGASSQDAVQLSRAVGTALGDIGRVRFGIGRRCRPPTSSPSSRASARRAANCRPGVPN